MPPEDLPALIAAVRSRLDAEVPPQQGKEFLLAMRVLMGLKYKEQFTESLMQTIAEMTDSVQWQQIFRSGKAEGKAQGLLEGERAAVIRLGTAKFGPASAAQIDWLQHIGDIEALGRMAVRVLTASGWNELFDGGE